MRWSSYNTLVRSDRAGCLLYNALSNSLLELDALHYRCAERLSEQPDAVPPGADPDFIAVLKARKVLVEDGEERTLLLERQARRDAASRDCRHLALTICPTLACNFRCPYCFETPSSARGRMQSETIERLVSFVRGYTPATEMSIVWFGGEPTLAFSEICEITKRIRELDIRFTGARMLTNGFLLDAGTIDRLNELGIDAVQITLDGPAGVHDARRCDRSGGPTFARILANVRRLMHSDYAGTCSIRVNVDRSNTDAFLALRSQLLEEFAERPLDVYPARIECARDHPYGQSCTMSVAEWSAFGIERYWDSGIAPLGGLFPGHRALGLCVATRRSAYVIGPAGEIYKCWEDVGKPEMVVGNVADDPPVTRRWLETMYRAGTDPWRDATCVACKTLPICGGGCANRRLRTRFQSEAGLEFCSPYRDALVPWLEVCCDAFHTMEICRTLLQPGAARDEHPGYRLIQADLSLGS